MAQDKAKKNDKKKRTWQYYTYSYVIPFIGVVAILFFMSACSPLFQFEYNITDFNCTMSIAKAIGHGEVYFKDIFEQRGIYLYFIHLFVAFMPYYYARLCVWILEVINLYCFYLILRMTGMKFGFKPKKHETWFVYSWTALLLVMLFPIWPTFSNPAAPEEWCIIPVAYAIYLTFKYDATQKLTLPESLLLGLGMGWIINVKYSVMMIPAGFFFGVGLHLLFTKRFKRFFEVAGTAIGGVILGSIPAFIYFAVNNAIGDWLKYYFLDNASSIGISTGPRIISYYMIMVGLFWILFMVGCCLSIQKMTHLGRKIMLSVAVFGLLGVILIGRTGIAYPMPLMVLSNMMAIVGILGTKEWVWSAPKSFRYFMIIGQLFVIASYGFNMIRQPFYETGSLRVLTPNYIKENNTKSESYKAGKIIEKFGGGKVLTLGTITNDIYMYNNEYPKFFYFDQTTMSYKRYPKSFDTQLSYVAKGEPTWVEFNTMTSVMPPNMSNKQYHHYVNGFYKSYRTMKDFNLAEVTAGVEHRALHPDQYRTYGQETIYQNGYRYDVELSAPKVLLKNYALIYMGLSEKGDITRIYHVLGNCEMLWVNKKMLIKHPELRKYVIDPGNINGTLNKYNRYERNHQ